MSKWETVIDREELKDGIEDTQTRSGRRDLGPHIVPVATAADYHDKTRSYRRIGGDATEPQAVILA